MVAGLRWTGAVARTFVPACSEGVVGDMGGGKVVSWSADSGLESSRLKSGEQRGSVCLEG